MHVCLNVDEIVRLLASALVTSGWRASAVAFACCCKKFEDPALDALWREQKGLLPLLDTFPEGIWDEAFDDYVSPRPYIVYYPLNRMTGKVFKKVPTTAEWVRFTKYSRRMRGLGFNLSEEFIPSNVLSVLQLRALNEPLLPNLKSLELKGATADIIPFVPLFLSHTTTDIDIQFSPAPPAVMVASMILSLPKLCPHVEHICLNPLPLDSTVTNATSEMLLTCNLDALRFFHVDSPLTEEATRVVLQLPNLRGLWAIFTGSIPLPEVSLPNLTTLDIRYHHDHSWLGGFHGTTFSKLTEVSFHAESQQVGAFLEAFESFALATSASTVLSRFKLHTSLAWSPNYYSLLAFKQLKELLLEFSCHVGCSSFIEDETLVALAQAMPKLEILQLGKTPCQAPSSVSIHGLIALAHHCLNLSKLCVHFQTDSMILALAGGAGQTPQGSYLPQEDCALTSLNAGAIPMPQQYMFPVSMALLRIFPRLHNIEYVDEGWKWVADAIKVSKQIDSFVHHSGKMHQPCF